MKEAMKWWLVHALHWAVLYGAFAVQADGPMYVLKFWAWVMAVLSCFLLTDKAVADAAKKPARPVRRWLSWVQAWATLGLLVWFGHIATGLAWAWVMVVIADHQDKVKTQRSAPAPVSAVGA
jgi:hypothetical protein